MIPSLFTGVLGLKNHQTRMDVIANNIANVNTTAFKMGRATFSDLFSKTIMGAAAPQGTRGGINPLQIGMGVQTAAVTNIMTQGQIQTTGRLTDVALDGNGFFIASDEGGGNTIYTRDGTFFLDRDGSLVTADGKFVQGWDRVTVDSNHDFNVDTSLPINDISFMQGEKLAAEATTKVNMKSNLNSDSRSIVADGIDPKEGYALKTDLLVDLYDNNSTNPTSLGIREGDWIEIHVTGRPTSRTTAGSVTGSGDGTTTQFQLIPSTDLPVTNLVVVAPPGLTRVDGPAPGAAEYMFDEGSGMITFGAAPAAAAGNIQLTYDTLHTADTANLVNQDKYMYVQVSNDTDLGDLELAINKAISALDQHKTINAEAIFDEGLGKFRITNEAVPGTGDELDVQVQINAVSGSAIRRGFLLKDSTFAGITGTRLSVVDGAVGNNGTRETVGIADYQTSELSLDYSNIIGTPVINAQVVSAYIEANDDGDGTIDLAAPGADTINGYTGQGQIQALDGTEKVTVNGTAWRSVKFFTGAPNEYVFDTSGGVPVIRFNTTTAGVAPSPTDNIVITFDVDNNVFDTSVQLDSTTNDYSLDTQTGNLSLGWSSGSATATLGAAATAQLTGAVKITASYTTEERSLVPPAEIMNSRWADFVQEWAPTTAGGSGRGRAYFNLMMDPLNSAIINDQGTSTQPTEQMTNLLQSGAVHRTSIDVYDSLGEAHTMQLVFTHVGSNFDLTTSTTYQNRWYWRAELAYDDVTGFDSMDWNDANNSSASRSGQIEFFDNGTINTTELPGNNGPIRFDASPIGANGSSTGAVNEVNIELDFDGDGKSNDPVLKRGVTQFASDFTTAAFAQNGWAMGILETFSVDAAGTIQGRYSNNIVKPLARLAVASFANAEGLDKVGNNSFAVTANSGLAMINEAMKNGNGQIAGGALEGSNVDLSEEFTNMIVTERGFQGNSRVITTSDEMLQELINLKR